MKICWLIELTSCLKFKDDTYHNVVDRQLFLRIVRLQTKWTVVDQKLSDRFCNCKLFSIVFPPEFNSSVFGLSSHPEDHLRPAEVDIGGGASWTIDSSWDGVFVRDRLDGVTGCYTRLPRPTSTSADIN